MTSYRISIQDFHPTTLNECKGHWSKGAKLKKRDKEYIAIHSRGIPKAKGKRIVCLTIYLGYKQRGVDPDSMWKSTLDALVHAGMLVDDSPKWVELMPVRYDRHADRQRETVIELIEAPSPRKQVEW